MSALNPQHVARALDGSVYGRRHVSAPGPGHDKKDRSLSITIDPAAPDGFVVFSHAGDDWRECRDYVKAKLGLPTFGDGRTAAPSRPVPSPQQQRLIDAAADKRRTAEALPLWHAARPPQGTLVERYLASRGLHLPPDVLAADVLRFHPACPIAGTKRPAIIALMRDILTDEPKAIHRTALRGDGTGKADMPDGGNAKRMFGPAGGAAIKLCPDDQVTYGLGICEGIETALAVIITGWRPIWALGSAGAIRNFPAPPGLDAVTIFADPDEAGQRAAWDAADRLAGEGIEVEILTPPDRGDWHDTLAEVAA